MASEDFLTGDPVWAKMKGYPAWPAKIVDPPSYKHKSSYVLFFGTGDYAWILDKNIIPHSESTLAEARSRKKPPTSYLNGISELVRYSKTYKRVKQPKIIKKEIIKNNVTKSSPVTVTKALRNVSNKYDRRELSKSLLKKAKAQSKRSYCDFNGKGSPSKFPKVRSISPNSDLHSPFRQNKPMYNSSKYVVPSDKKFGFIGLGTMGKKIVKILLESGHDVTLWNKTLSLCDPFVDMGAEKACSPAELIKKCDITFCCVSNPEASKAVFFGENGVLRGLEQTQNLGLPRKGYIEMTSIDHITSQQISEAVTRNGGTYLEAQISGSSKDAEEGSLLILVAGDGILFKDCLTCLHAIAKYAYYMGCNIGVAAQLNLILSTVTGTACAALAEAMVLIERLNLQKSDFLTCLQNGPMASKKIIDTALSINDLMFQKVTALKHVQKDISLTLSMAETCSQPMTVTANANEIYKRGRRMFYSNEDMSAVYKVVKY